MLKALEPEATGLGKHESAQRRKDHEPRRAPKHKHGIRRRRGERSAAPSTAQPCQAAASEAQRPAAGTSRVTNKTVQDALALAPGAALPHTCVPPSLDTPLYRGQSLEPSDRMLENRLFYRYINRIKQRDVWANELPKGYFNAALPFGHDYPHVMEMVISVGAIYKAREQPRDPGTMATIHRYANRSIAGQIAALRSGINGKNFEALYTNASLIAVQMLLYRMLLPPQRSSLQSLADWYRAWGGVQSLIRGLPAEFSASRYAFYPVACMTQWPSTGRESPSSGPIFAFLLGGLSRMGTPHATYAAYQAVVHSLSCIYSRPLRHLHCQLLITRPDVFVQCIERCEPTALVLVGTHCALTRILDKPFICDESSEADLQLIMTHLAGLHRRLLQRAVDLIGEKMPAIMPK